MNHNQRVVGVKNGIYELSFFVCMEISRNDGNARRCAPDLIFSCLVACINMPWKGGAGFSGLKKWLAGIQASGYLRKDATGNGNDAKLFREVREHFLQLRWEMMER
jgi:hypothetical protein